MNIESGIFDCGGTVTIRHNYFQFEGKDPKSNFPGTVAAIIENDHALSVENLQNKDIKVVKESGK